MPWRKRTAIHEGYGAKERYEASRILEVRELREGDHPGSLHRPNKRSPLAPILARTSFRLLVALTVETRYTQRQQHE